MSCGIHLVHVYRAYAKGLQFRPESAHLWHDLGVAYLYLGQVYSYQNVFNQN